MVTALNVGEDLGAIGQLKIEWAEAHSPVLTRLAQGLIEAQAFDGMTIGVDLPTEPKTGYLCLLLKRAGGTVVLGADPFFVHADVTAALERHGIVLAGDSSTSESGPTNQERILEHRPNLILDGAGQLGALAHSTHREALANLVGVAEETTTGVRRYRSMADQGVLQVPVFAANDARMKTLFDNRYGTGQSGLGALMTATNLMVPGMRIVVVGYGWVGRGFARFASAMGARVTVTEVDPVRGVEAYADGFEVMPLLKAVEAADVVVTASGTPGAVTDRHFERMKDGVVLENIGGTGSEFDVPGLRAIAKDSRPVRPHVTEFRLSDGRRINLLGDGEVFNVTAAAEGHPIEIMDSTFAIQLLCLARLAEVDSPMEPGVHPVPRAFDEIVARARLEAAGMRIDELDDRQREALASWQVA